MNGFANAGAFLELRLRGIDYDKDRNVAQAPARSGGLRTDWSGELSGIGKRQPIGRPELNEPELNEPELNEPELNERGDHPQVVDGMGK